MKHKATVLLAMGLLLVLVSCDARSIGLSQFPGQPRKADCIMRKESGYNPRAVSPTGDYGLFQINRSALYGTFQPVTGQPWSSIFNPYWNAKFARWIYVRQGWSPWTTNRLC